MMVDIKNKNGLQQIPTSPARLLGMSLANNRVYVATTPKELACRGCIVVYAPDYGSEVRRTRQDSKL